MEGRTEIAKKAKERAAKRLDRLVDDLKGMHGDMSSMSSQQARTAKFMEAKGLCPTCRQSQQSN